MLERTCSIALAVKECAPAVETFARIFDTRVCDDRPDPRAGARRVTLQWGEDQLELFEPTGPGPVADFLEQGRRGLFLGGFSLADPAALAGHLARQGVRVHDHGGDRFTVFPGDNGGIGIVLSKRVAHERAGLNGKIWQITYAVANRSEAVERFNRLFGIGGMFTNLYVSDRYGYDGAITWFDARDRGLLDSLEYLEPTNPDAAVARFLQRNGEGIYMASVETDDIEEIRRRVTATGPGWDGSDGFGGFIHPLRLHGLLLGLTTFEHWNAQRPLPGVAGSH